MHSMIFQVSAKTARLIGRENISDVDGAIIELVKNGYDADAECVYIKYINPYNWVPKTLTASEVNKYFENRKELISQNYTVQNGIYVLNEKNKGEKYADLEYYVHALSTIIVLDNGTGFRDNLYRCGCKYPGTGNQ